MAVLDNTRGFMLTHSQQYEVLAIKQLGFGKIEDSALYIAMFVEDYLLTIVDERELLKLLRRTEFRRKHKALWNFVISNLNDRYQTKETVNRLRKIFVQAGWNFN